MKYFFTLFVGLLFTKCLTAQTPMSTNAEYNGQKYPGYYIEYNIPPDEAKDVIVNQLKSRGYNPDKSKGFLVYRGVRLSELSDSPQDILFSIDRKSRKEKDKSIVTMITAKAGEIPEDKVKGAKGLANVESSPNASSFLKSFQPQIDIEANNLAVAAQQDEVIKAEKKLQSLQQDSVKLVAKIKSYQDDLQTNSNNQKKQIEEIEKQKAILEQRKAEKPGK